MGSGHGCPWLLPVPKGCPCCSPAQLATGSTGTSAAAGAWNEISNAGCTQGWGTGHRDPDSSPRTPQDPGSPTPAGSPARRAVWRVSERGCLSEPPSGRQSRQGAPVWLHWWVGRTDRQGGGQRGTMGTATWRKANVQPRQEETVAGAGLTLRVRPPRIRGSPCGEGKHSMEELKDSCSGGHICARNVPGVNLRCPELRDFGPFAKQEQSPAEPHGSGVQGSHTEVSPDPWREGSVPTGGTGSSDRAGSVCLVPPKRAGVLHPWDRAGQRHGEWLLGVTGICSREI